MSRPERRANLQIIKQFFGRNDVGHHLLIDGDDTLWENNIYFEEAIAAFVTFLAHSTLSTEEIRQVLDEAERHVGYGSANFARSLEHTYRHLVEREVTPEDIARVHQLATEIREHPMEILPGVPETLAYLAPRHDLLLLTKGDFDEQRLKIEASGLESHFQKTIVVGEKDPDTYRRVLGDLRFELRQSWMIGNSPRSDINPALEVGMNAVLIPHPHTWRLEHQEVQLPDRGQILLTIPSFAELQRHF
jgi:putative hydrolase of the HAD superfamily